MKAIVCEMCGSQEFAKQDGLFICQGCGMKYSVEEAKKLMIEVEGEPKVNTVRIDNSKELENLYLIARRAKNDNNAENASKYYDMIMIKDPTSWEASFYVVYFKAQKCKIAEIQSASISVSNCIDTVLNLIKDYVNDRNEQIAAVKEVASRCINIANMLFNGAKSHYDGIDVSIQDRYRQEMLNNCCAARDIDYLFGDYTDSIFKDYPELKSTAVEAWKEGITKHNSVMSYFANKEVNKNKIMEYVSKIQKYESSYVAPIVNTSSGCGCYVATAVYGSYDCPQVWTLRRYRDYTLSQTWYGRTFIKTYYAVSPTLVKWFGHTDWFRNMWKPRLDKMVKKLNNKGVKNTPYNDRKW